jgi:hypothetical protein
MLSYAKLTLRVKKNLGCRPTTPRAVGEFTKKRYARNFAMLSYAKLTCVVCNVTDLCTTRTTTRAGRELFPSCFLRVCYAQLRQTDTVCSKKNLGGRPTTPRAVGEFKKKCYARNFAMLSLALLTLVCVVKKKNLVDANQRHPRRHEQRVSSKKVCPVLLTSERVARVYPAQRR